MLLNTTQVLPGTGIIIPIGVFETIPVIYLLILSIMDYTYDFNIKTHFFPIISEIRNKMNYYRTNSPTGSCPIVGTPGDSCPITHSLENVHSMIDGGQSDLSGNDLWTIVRKGFALQNQATYFEIIIIQFFVLFLITAGSWVSLIGFFAALIFFIGPYVGSTYIKKNPVVLFQFGSTPAFGYEIPNGLIRILLVVVILVFNVILLM